MKSLKYSLEVLPVVVLAKRLVLIGIFVSQAAMAGPMSGAVPNLQPGKGPSYESIALIAEGHLGTAGRIEQKYGLQPSFGFRAINGVDPGITWPQRTYAYFLSLENVSQELKREMEKEVNNLKSSLPDDLHEYDVRKSDNPSGLNHRTFNRFKEILARIRDEARKATSGARRIGVGAAVTVVTTAVVAVEAPSGQINIGRHELSVPGAAYNVLPQRTIPTAEFPSVGHGSSPGAAF
jgi:hypothetical protein